MRRWVNRRRCGQIGIGMSYWRASVRSSIRPSPDKASLRRYRQASAREDFARTRVAGNSWGANKKVLLTIYRSLIRSVIDYGAIAYNSASDNLKNRLDVIQHKALRIACGAFCSTAASALQVETGELPLSLRRSQQELKYVSAARAWNNLPSTFNLTQNASTSLSTFRSDLKTFLFQAIFYRLACERTRPHDFVKCP